MNRFFWRLGWFCFGFLMVQLFFLWLIPVKAADEYAIGTILGSDHWIGEDYNENQWPSLYGGWRYGDDAYSAGFYQNSNDKRSYFFTYVRRTGKYTSVFFGGATGYDSTPLMPVAGIAVNIGPAKISVLPGLAAYGLEHRWKPE